MIHGLQREETARAHTAYASHVRRFEQAVSNFGTTV